MIADGIVMRSRHDQTHQRIQPLFRAERKSDDVRLRVLDMRQQIVMVGARSKVDLPARFAEQVRGDSYPDAVFLAGHRREKAHSAGRRKCDARWRFRPATPASGRRDALCHR